jgi:hypothetical protein
MKRTVLLLSLIVILFLSACASQAETPTPTRRPTQRPSGPTATPEIIPPDYAPTLDPAITETPGLLILGYTLTENGRGIDEAAICRRYASYPAELVATSDGNGYFQANFAPIPGDEMVTVWAIAEGYVFEPQEYNWRHYAGFELYKMRFVGTLSMLQPDLEDCR